MPEQKSTSLLMKIDGKWLHINEETVRNHPGGAVIRQYANADATQIFHAFHEGSKKAYKHLEVLKTNAWQPIEGLEESLGLRLDKADVNTATYDISVEEEKKIVESFERLRRRVVDWGLMDARPWYYVMKSFTTLTLLLIAFSLQYFEWYLTSAICLAVAWQQFGWLTHEFAHHQPTKNREFNNIILVIFGNLIQGFSADWWKDKHNTHHAVTNIIDHDCDINIRPLLALIPSDLLKYNLPMEKFILKFIPYQNLYFTLTLPFLRLSWAVQSLMWVFGESVSSEFRIYRRNALTEQSLIMAHWSCVLLQLYLLPSMSVRVMYFLVSQLLSGFLIAYIITFSHNSVDKYPANSRLLNNFACLQIFTTRNMTPGPFTDWLWGGLNYQIEHHLFPTMPRCNLSTCMLLVKEFCRENNLPYMVNDYFEGYAMNLKQLENMARFAQTKAS